MIEQTAFVSLSIPIVSLLLQTSYVFFFSIFNIKTIYILSFDIKCHINKLVHSENCVEEAQEKGTILKVVSNSPIEDKKNEMDKRVTKRNITMKN